MASQVRLPSWCSSDRWLHQQQPVFEEVLQRFEEGNKLVILSAPTGQGKSLLGQMVRQALGISGIYLTSTLTLQDQILGDFPDTRLVKGRSNYLPDNPSPGLWNAIPTCADCDLDNETKLCSFDSDPGDCPYLVARDEAMQAQMTCTNYAYFLGECSQLKSRFSGRGLVVADECHSIEGELLRHVSISISPRMQKWLNLHPPEKKTVESSWVSWFEYAVPHITERMDRIRGTELSDVRRKQTLARLIGNMSEIASDLEGWIYSGYERGNIEFKPITVNQMSQRKFWLHGKRFLAMSATVIPELLVENLGYEDSWAPVFAPSTFPAENRPIYYCPSARMTNKEKEVEWPKMGRALRAVVDRHPDERILVHAHSYSLTKAMVEELSVIERPVFHYFNSKERDGAISDYESPNNPNAVLIASSLEQGYDGKDEKCSVIVVLKVPFASLGDKQVSARLYSTKAGNFWYAATTAEMLMQALGRGVRHENDHATHYILDEVFGSFFSKWKTYDGHRFFPGFLLDALHWDSPVRFELTRAVRTLASSTPVA